MLGNRAAHAQGTLPDGRVLVADGLNTSTTTVSTVELLTTPLEPHANPTHCNRYADSYCGTADNSDTAAAANTGASPVGRSGSEKMITD